MNAASRLILASVLLIGLVTPVATHMPSRCGPEMASVLKTMAAANASSAVFYALNLHEAPRTMIAELAAKMRAASLIEGIAMGNLFSCIK